jgi:hypothetical protein
MDKIQNQDIRLDMKGEILQQSVKLTEDLYRVVLQPDFI